MPDHHEPPRAGRFYAVSYQDDIPTFAPGSFIPKRVSAATRRASGWRRVQAVASVLLLPSLGFLAVTASGLLGYSAVAALSVTNDTSVVVVNPYTESKTPLNYGVQVALAETQFYSETRSAFIDEGLTFIDVDLTKRQLRYFKDGVLIESVPVLAKGSSGSWCQTPAGLYEVTVMKERQYTSIDQIYQPWSIGFHGNYFIHGWPEYADGSPAPESFTGGCIRLGNEDAERLFALVERKTPVLVYDRVAEPEPFLYQAKVPNIEAPNYLIADIESSTVLAGSELETPVPIASVTKLMTALVAIENLPIDSMVNFTPPTFVESLVPRLQDRTRASVRSLLQLLLVESSNESAEVIAEAVGRERFITAMNEKAAALGMKSTRFADPSGLSSDNVSSGEDLLRLVSYLYTNHRFLIEMTASAKRGTPYLSETFGSLVNFNEVEGLENFIGGKVGETNIAGQTSVTLHRLIVKGEERVVAIVLLGSNKRSEEVATLLRYAEERFGQ